MQNLKYFNNSKDTIDKVYFHLYFNAFQPGSMMDVRSRSLPDPDRRVMDRISKLNKKEIGFHEIKKIEQDASNRTYYRVIIKKKSYILLDSKKELKQFNSLLADYSLALIGGDLTKGPLSITIQAHGIVPKGKFLCRSGAKPDDSIYVTGELGAAAYALR